MRHTYAYLLFVIAFGAYLLANTKYKCTVLLKLPRLFFKYFRSYGIFRLTDPGGMEVLRGCNESGFHTHRETTDGSPIYETCSKVQFNPNLRFEIVDLRSGA